MPVNNSVRLGVTAVNSTATPAANVANPEPPAQHNRRRPASGEIPGMPPSRRQRLESSPDFQVPNASIAASRPARNLQDLVTNASGGARSRATLGGTTTTVDARPAAPSPAMISKARTFVTALLNNALAHLNGLTDQNRDPALAGLPIVKMDAVLAPAMIIAENRRNPGLNLVALHTSTADTRFDDGPPPIAGSRDLSAFIETAPLGRYRAIIDDGTHVRAADIRKTASGSSVIVVDSLRKEEDENEYDDYADNFSAECGQAAKCAFIPLDLQKSAFGCHTFSISLALKMHDREGIFDRFHDIVRDGSDPGAQVARAKRTQELGSLLVLDAGPLIDARMMKHSHSSNSVKRFLEANPDQAEATVNKQQPPETLAARTARHLVTREVPQFAASRSNAPAGKTRIATFNNSIEIKRIALLKRAITYAESAPPKEIVQLATALLKARSASS